MKKTHNNTGGRVEFEKYILIVMIVIFGLDLPIIINPLVADYTRLI
jgi:hypothetical protein